jgi:RNA recognition motif-containing protein
MKPIERWICIGIVVVFAFFVVHTIGGIFEVSKNGNYVDTKRDSVDRINPIQPSLTNNYPTKIIYQIIQDTTRRHQAEKETIITGVKIDSKKNEIEIDKIDSTGKITKETHKIEEGSTAIIDNKNFEEKKKTKVGKILQKSKKTILRGLQVVGGVAIVYVTMKSL